MSERDISKDENTPHVPEEQEESNPASDQRNVEEQAPVVESRNSDNGTPPLEGAVGGEAEGGRLSEEDRKLIKAGKEDLFERLFNREYTQAKAPILERRRHKAERQTGRRRHFSDEPATTTITTATRPVKADRPDSPKLWHFTEVRSVVVNQAGAIIGRAERESERFGSENGPSPFDIELVEDSEHSIGSTETALIEDVYARDFPNTSLLNHRLSIGRLQPFRCPPPPNASDSLQPLPDTSDSLQPLPDTSDSLQPLPDTSDSLQPAPSGDRRLIDDQQTSIPVRQRRLGVDESISRGEPESLDVIEDLPESEEPTDLPVLSVFPQRKISSDSSADSLELGEEAISYRPSSENDACPRMPDIYEGTVEELTRSWESLRISSGIVYSSMPDEVDQSPVLIGSPGGAEAENKPDGVDQGQETVIEESPVLGCSAKGEDKNELDVSDQANQETINEQNPV